MVRGGADDGADGVGVRAGVGDLELGVLVCFEALHVELMRAAGEGAGLADVGGGGVDVVVVDEEGAVEVDQGAVCAGAGGGCAVAKLVRVLEGLAGE